MTFERIKQMMEWCDTSNQVFPPTLVYNEGWMLCLVLDWFSRHRNEDEHAFSFGKNDRWFSEGLLATQFKPLRRGDGLGEGDTHADGAIGRFTVGGRGKSDICRLKSNSRFVVIEAKMYSELGQRVTNAAFYNQAARTVACMAEVIKKADVDLARINPLGFYVVAPEDQLCRQESFQTFMNRNHIKDTVLERVNGYPNKVKEEWFEKDFRPVCEKMDIRCLSWETVLAFIYKRDKKYGSALKAFYKKCRKYGQQNGQANED